jgi:hypothetical protein
MVVAQSLAVMLARVTMDSASDNQHASAGPIHQLGHFLFCLLGLTCDYGLRAETA